MPDNAAPQFTTVSRAEELNHMGAMLFSQGEVEPARVHFLAALAIEPENHSALQNLGAALRNLKHYEAAESVARRSVKVSGNNPYCRSNLGVSQLGLRKFKEARATLRGVLKDLGDYGPSWHNYGLVLYMMGEHTEALAAFEKALSLDASNPQLHSDRALSLLALGRIQDGLEAYEVRWQLLHRASVWNVGIPEWKGEPVSGKKILVHHEQGFGDSLMLSRFIPQLHKRGADVTIAVPSELSRLFATSFPFATIIGFGSEEIQTDVEYDYHVPMLSLVRWLGVKSTKDIDPRPYLIAPNETKIKLPNAKLKIGICWASGNHSKELLERRRLVPLLKFLPLTELKDTILVSLQKGEDAKDIANSGLEGIVFDASYKLDDFASTADVISQLDCVISVDSAVAHLTGALGETCFMLSPYTRCWRWWDRRTGAPWYNNNNMLQFHQSESGSWDSAMERLIGEVRGRYMR